VDFEEPRPCSKLLNFSPLPTNGMKLDFTREKLRITVQFLR
jgi:hypothetical protein